MLPGAEISFAHGSVRIPEKWTLQLNEQRFVLEDAPHGVDTLPDTDRWSMYALDDLQPTSTAADVAQNIASWLRWQGIDLRSAPIRLVYVKSRAVDDFEEWFPTSTAAEFDVYSQSTRGSLSRRSHPPMDPGPGTTSGATDRTPPQPRTMLDLMRRRTSRW